MARKRHSDRTNFRFVPARRVAFRNTNPLPLSLPRRFVVPFRNNLSLIEDRRRYHPHGFNRSYRALDGRRLVPRHRIRSTRYVLPNDVRAFPILADLRSYRELPRDAVICARRRIRREVILALGYGGRRGQRKPRFNPDSDVRCEK